MQIRWPRPNVGHINRLTTVSQLTVKIVVFTMSEGSVKPVRSFVSSVGDLSSLPGRWKVDVIHCIQTSQEPTRRSLTAEPSQYLATDQEIFSWYTRQVNVVPLLPDMWVMVCKNRVEGEQKEIVFRECQKRSLFKLSKTG